MSSNDAIRRALLPPRWSIRATWIIHRALYSAGCDEAPMAVASSGHPLVAVQDRGQLGVVSAAPDLGVRRIALEHRRQTIRRREPGPRHGPDVRLVIATFGMSDAARAARISSTMRRYWRAQ